MKNLENIIRIIIKNITNDILMIFHQQSNDILNDMFYDILKNIIILSTTK